MENKKGCVAVQLQYKKCKKPIYKLITELFV